MRLFQPDNFSNPNIVYKPLDNKKESVELKKVVAFYYPQNRIEEIKKLEATEINSNNFRVVFINKETKKVILLRRFNILRNKPQVVFYLNLLPELAVRGATVSRALKNVKGEYLTETPNGKLYAAFDFIEGRHFSPTKEGFKAVAKAVAALHSAFNQIEGKCGREVKEFEKKIRGVYFTMTKNYSADDFKEIANLVASKSNLDTTEKNLLKEVKFYKKLIAEIKVLSPKMKILPRHIVHSDLHPHNVLMKDTEVMAIIDFDFIRMGQQARDAVMALYRFGRQFLVNKKKLGEEGQRKYARELGKLFMENYLDVNQLNSKEVELMPWLLRDEFMKKILTVLKSVYKDKYFVWAKDLPKFMMAIREIDYFWP